MMAPRDDVSHPVPPAAFPRCKESRRFILIGVQDSAFGTANLYCNPAHERARVFCNLFVRSDR